MWCCSFVLEKLRVANMVVRMAPFSFRRALNFFRQSTVSCLCTTDATRSRCCGWNGERVAHFRGRKRRRRRTLNHRQRQKTRFGGLLRLHVIRTQIHGCLRASLAVILLLGFTVSIWLMRFFASGVTVSHSGDGYYQSGRENHESLLLLLLLS